MQFTRTGTAEAAIRGRILQAIFERRLAPGEKLTEDRLADLFGVSRTVVRQALARLAQDGIVAQQPHRGAYVAAPSRAEARHIMAVRHMVEPEIAATAAREADANAIARLEQHLVEESAARSNNDRAALVRLTGMFHVTLAEVAGNPILVRLVTELQALSSLAILLYARADHDACPRDEHGRIVAAVAAGDPETARAVMQSHLHHVEGDLALSEPPAAAADLAVALGLAAAPGS